MSCDLPDALYLEPLVGVVRAPEAGTVGRVAAAVAGMPREVVAAVEAGDAAS